MVIFITTYDYNPGGIYPVATDLYVDGRENVYLNGALIGYSNEEINKMYDDIWKFAELEQND